MKFHLISDNIDTIVGMRLAGITGVLVHEDEEVKKALTDAMAREDVAVILMTEKLVKLCPDLVYDHSSVSFRFREKSEESTEFCPW